MIPGQKITILVEMVTNKNDVDKFFEWIKRRIIFYRLSQYLVWGDRLGGHKLVRVKKRIDVSIIGFIGLS
jgi:hypothetical protein